MYRYIIRLIEILRQISIWQRAKGKRSGNKNIKIKKSGSRVKRHKHWFLMLNPVFTNNAMVFTTILYVHCPLRALDSGDWVQQVKSGPAMAQPPVSSVPTPSTDPASGLGRTGNWTSGPRHPPLSSSPPSRAQRRRKFTLLLSTLKLLLFGRLISDFSRSRPFS